MKQLLLLNIFLLVQIVAFAFAPTDSIGLTKKDNKYFILHKIDPRETLSGIAKKYKVSIADLQKENAEIIKKDKIKSGQVILIPARSVTVPPTLAAQNQQEKKANQEVKKQNFKEKWHTVKNEESLYKIAFSYSIHIDSLKKWNNLANNDIKENDKLVVGYTKPKEEQVYVPLSGENVVRENGMGEMITGTNNTELKLALHRKLPIGSYVRVVSESTGSSVTVKIIGKIPDIDSDDKIIIKLSQAACKAIGMVNERFPITLVYQQQKKKKK
jgi:LysM repeat protein